MPKAEVKPPRPVYKLSMNYAKHEVIMHAKCECDKRWDVTFLLQNSTSMEADVIEHARETGHRIEAHYCSSYIVRGG